MKTDLLPTVIDFIRKENIDMSISEDNPSDFWLDDKFDSIVVRFKINDQKHKIFYDIYSPEFTYHLNELSINDVERLEFLAEENRRWKFAESIENIWLILDNIKIWAIKNNYSLTKQNLI